MNLRRYEFSYILAHRVIINRKTVKSAENTSCSGNWRKYEFFDTLTHSVVISLKTVKPGKKRIFDILSLRSRRYEFSVILAHTVSKGT